MASIVLKKTPTELKIASINGGHLLVQTWTIDPDKKRIQVVGHEYVFNKTLISQQYFSKTDLDDMIKLYKEKS